MEFRRWEVYYRRILQDFGYEESKDNEAARMLSTLLQGERIDPSLLDEIIRGKPVSVVGDAPSLDRQLSEIDGVVISADEATSTLLAHGIVPEIIMTDLDGKIPDLRKANEQGSIVIIHAHGDNIEQLVKWAPLFRGKVLGTTQSQPFDDLHNFGGFTDGDRGVFLADHFDASQIRLVGFDFENVNPKEENPETKRRKLDWAYILITTLGNERIIF